MKKEKRTDLTVGHIYSLKDFTAPKVWMGDYFECLLTDQKIEWDARFDGDFLDQPTHIRDWKEWIYKPERFSALMLDKEIERHLMVMFEQSVGYEFRVKASPLTDIVDGVDWKDKMIKGRKYGDFAVSLCELTGPTKQTPES